MEMFFASQEVSSDAHADLKKKQKKNACIAEMFIPQSGCYRFVTVKNIQMIDVTVASNSNFTEQSSFCAGL